MSQSLVSDFQQHFGEHTASNFRYTLIQRL